MKRERGQMEATSKKRLGIHQWPTEPTGCASMGVFAHAGVCDEGICMLSASEISRVVKMNGVGFKSNVNAKTKG